MNRRKFLELTGAVTVSTAIEGPVALAEFFNAPAAFPATLVSPATVQDLIAAHQALFSCYDDQGLDAPVNNIHRSEWYNTAFNGLYCKYFPSSGFPSNGSYWEIRYERSDVLADDFLNGLYELARGVFMRAGRFSECMQRLRKNAPEAKKAIQLLIEHKETRGEFYKQLGFAEPFNAEPFNIDTQILNKDWTVGWPDVNENGRQRVIRANIDEGPEVYIHELCRSVKNLRGVFEPGKIEHIRLRDPTNGAAQETFLNISGRICDATQSWLPDLAAEFFPDVWQEMLEGKHEELRREIKPDQRKPNRERERIEAKKYYNDAWAQIVIGNDIY